MARRQLDLGGRGGQCVRRGHAGIAACRSVGQHCESPFRKTRTASRRDAMSHGSVDTDQLTPIQTDIYLDERLGSAQSYTIGAHWRIRRPVDPARLGRAVVALEPLLKPAFLQFCE